VDSFYSNISSIKVIWQDSYARQHGLNSEQEFPVTPDGDLAALDFASKVDGYVSYE
tara:strand:- start:1223 stop:1390 length:168 start_codon:yes stop_codon:yes gene_type:complete